ncbi:MAG: cytochrome b/b6 domain-containing protein [Candidatus Puniceispirillaceae bacterium]
MASTNKHYSILAKSFHWFTVIIFAYGITKQVNEISDLHSRALLKFEMQFALIFLALILFRYIYMSKTQISALQKEAPKWQIWISAIALTGLTIGQLFYMGFTEGMIIGVVTELHGISVSISYFLIALHIVAAIYHRLKKDGVWSAMVPYLFKE